MNLDFLHKNQLIVVGAAIFLLATAYFIYMRYFSPSKRAPGAIGEDSLNGGKLKTASGELYYFHTTNCPHCKKASPVIDAIEKKFIDIGNKAIKVRRVDCSNLDEENVDGDVMGLVKEYSVSGVPHVVFKGDNGSNKTYDKVITVDDLLRFIAT